MLIDKYGKARAREVCKKLAIAKTLTGIFLAR